MPSPHVIAVVLNYNGKDLTLASLASLSAMRYPSFELLVVDNGSTDGSFEAVAAAFPQASQIRLEKNLGPGGGMNAGLRWVLERRFDYALLLNNDIEVDPEMLAEMVRAAEADPTIGCVGPKAYYFWDRERIWSAGGIVRFKESVTRERGDRELDTGQYDRDQEVDYVNGVAVLIRRDALLKTGLWDETYFLGVEDADWCVRMKQHGYRCWFAHKARLWHMVSHTIGVYKPHRTFNVGRSTAIFVRRWANPWQWLTFFFFYTLSFPVAFLREMPKGNHKAAVAKLRGVIAGLRMELPPPPGPALSRQVENRERSGE